MLYRIGEIEVDPAQGFVRRAGVGDVYLRQQTLQVLLYLLTHRDRLVGKEELRQAIWGDTAVTDDAFVQCVVDIRKALGDDSRIQRLIKTVPKIGYRFVGAVEVVAAGEQADAPPQPAALPPPATPASRRVVAGVAAIVLLALAGAGWLAYQRLHSAGPRADVAPPAAGVPRVAVMYFDNASGNRDLAWLHQGLADMLITDLSRFSGIAPLSRDQLDQLLSRVGLSPTDAIPLERAIDVARQSHAQAVVLGSFAVLGDKTRVEVHVYDVASGRLLGSDTALADARQQILTEVDVLAVKVAGRLGIQSTPSRPGLAEARTESLEAYRYYAIGLERSNALEPVEAILMFQKAISLDPGFAMAYARIGYTYALTRNDPDRARPYLEKAFRLSDRLTDRERSYIAAWYAIAHRDYPDAVVQFRAIVARYPSEVEAYWRLGGLLYGELKFDEARQALLRGLALDPDNKDICNTLGTIYSQTGHHADAIAMHQRYVALAPNEANAYDSLGLTFQWAGRYDDAMTAYQRARSLSPNFEVAIVHLGNLFFQLGRYREAIDAFHTYIGVARFDNDRVRGWTAIGWVEHRRGRADAADAAIKKAAQFSTGSAEPLLMALDRGDVTTADALFKVTLREYPGRGSRLSRRFGRYVEARMALAHGRSVEAIDGFKAALKEPPPIYHYDALEDCLANAYAALGRWPEAIAEYQRILQLSPEMPMALYHLAIALEASGDRAAARPILERFLTVWQHADADAPPLLDARRRLAASSATSAVASRPWSQTGPWPPRARG